MVRNESFLLPNVHNWINEEFVKYSAEGNMLRNWIYNLLSNTESHRYLLPTALLQKNGNIVRVPLWENCNAGSIDPAVK